MKIFWKGLCAVTLVLISIFVITVVADECLNLDSYIVKNMGLADSQIWKGFAANLIQCMQMCIRLTLCKSLNYNEDKTHCDLNALTKADAKTKYDKSSVYSEFEWLPESLDPSCYSRPCADDELCVPTRTSDTCTKHYCMKSGQRVCPVPAGGVAAGRHVGATFRPICPKGFIGHDSAKCEMPGKWSTKLDKKCYPIYDHRCKDNTICNEIGGICSDNKCKCEENMVYDDDTHACEYVCDDPPKADDINATQISENSREVIYECKYNYVSNITSENMAKCTENGWILNFECFQCDEPTGVDDEVELSGKSDDQVRSYECKEDVGLKGSGTIRCSPNRTWVPQGFNCHGMRITNVTKDDKYIKMGYLEMFIDGSWVGVSVKNWSWQATNVTCKDIDGSFKFGGTFNYNWFNKTSPDINENTYIVGTNCSGTENTLTDCGYNYTNDGESESAMVITCFKTEFTGSSTKTVQESGNITIVIMPGTFTDPPSNGYICKDDDWSDIEGAVTCKSLNKTLTLTYSTTGTAVYEEIAISNVQCSGDEPHLFYCRYRGWGYANECPYDNALKVYCK